MAVIATSATKAKGKGRKGQRAEGRRAGGIVTPHTYGFKRYVWGETFRFGYDEPTANARCLRLLALKATLEGQGATAWTAETKAKAWDIAKGKDEASAAPNAQTVASSPNRPSAESVALGYAVSPSTAEEAPATKTDAQAVAMLYDALDAYLAHIEKHNVAPGYWSYSGLVRAQKKAIANMPLARVGAKELITLVRHWKSKPSGTRCDWFMGADGKQNWKVVETGKPLSAISVKKYIGAARQAFSWIASEESGYEWNAPNLKGIFEFKNAEFEKLKGDAEDMAEIKALSDESSLHFDLDELKALYGESHRGYRRLYFLLSLNCGFCTSELAGLRVGNLFLDDDNAAAPYLMFKRPKTKVRGKWYLWAETATALRKHLSKLEAQGKAKNLDRVFLTEEGLPLISKSKRNANGSGGNRNDAVKLVWKRWKKTAKVTRLSWKNMRKTASQLVRAAATDLGMNGDYMSELFLAHVAPAMSRKYNERDNAEFLKLGEILAEVRKGLKFLDKTERTVINSKAE